LDQFDCESSWKWEVTNDAGKTGVTNGSYLCPLKSSYSYAKKVKIKQSSSSTSMFPSQLNVATGKIVEIDLPSFNWNCYPARSNGVEGFVFKWQCDVL